MERMRRPAEPQKHRRRREERVHIGQTRVRRLQIRRRTHQNKNAAFTRCLYRPRCPRRHTRRRLLPLQQLADPRQGNKSRASGTDCRNAAAALWRRKRDGSPRAAKHRRAAGGQDTGGAGGRAQSRLYHRGRLPPPYRRQTRNRPHL